jgi:hypothetical protein
MLKEINRHAGETIYEHKNILDKNLMINEEMQGIYDSLQTFIDKSDK